MKAPLAARSLTVPPSPLRVSSGPYRRITTTGTPRGRPAQRLPPLTGVDRRHSPHQFEPPPFSPAMGWLHSSFDRLEGRLLAKLCVEAAEAAAATSSNGAAGNGTPTAALPQSIDELPPCVQRYLQLADAASCNYT